MIPRRSIPVEEFRVVAPTNVAIRVSTSGVGFACLSVKTGEVIATCSSAKRLADWAFENGAFEVRHEYDCKLSDSEP